MNKSAILFAALALGALPALASTSVKATVNGGSGVEYAATLTKVANWADSANVEKIVNGHFATTTTRAELREFTSYIQDFVKTAQDAKKAGKTVEDVVTAWKTPAKYAGYEPMTPPLRVRENAKLIFSETK